MCPILFTYLVFEKFGTHTIRVCTEPFPSGDLNVSMHVSNESYEINMESKVVINMFVISNSKTKNKLGCQRRIFVSSDEQRAPERRMVHHRLA